MTWNLVPDGGTPLVADIHVTPARPTRGQRVTLKAVVLHASKARECAWTFQARPGHSVAGDGTPVGGDSLGVALLEDVDVTLTVTDGSRSVSVTKTLTVTPRKWKTKAYRPVDDTQWDGGAILFEAARFGVTHCAFCDGSHALHHARLDYSDVYTAQQLDDPGGPHHRFWWVTDQSLEMKLVCHVNAYLFGAELAELPGQRARDVHAIQRQVHDHEHAHAKLATTALKGNDPAPDVERLVAPPSDDHFTTDVEVILGTAEDDILEADLRRGRRPRPAHQVGPPRPAHREEHGRRGADAPLPLHAGDWRLSEPRADLTAGPPAPAGRSPADGAVVLRRDRRGGAGSGDRRAAIGSNSNADRFVCGADRTWPPSPTRSATNSRIA